tara:strand:+ start:1507 stop:2361 length:855 start_codon:yes stop_codon:yes gene_type:complete
MATIFSEDFGTGSSGTSLPSGWARSINSTASNGVIMTAYGSTQTQVYSSTLPSLHWGCTDTRTTSSNTGPGGAMDGGINATNGDWTFYDGYQASHPRYMFFESSSGMASTSLNYITGVRTSQFDLTGYTGCELSFWFHMYNNYNSGFGSLGVALTTSTNDMSSASQAATGLGFTSDTAGGGTIISWTNADGSSIQSGVRLGGSSQQSDGHTSSINDNNRWRKATVDLSAADGVSGVYLYLMFITYPMSPQFVQDCAIDNIHVTGTTGGSPITALDNSILFGTNF